MSDMDLETYATRLAAKVAALEQALQERESLVALMALEAGGEVKIFSKTIEKLESIRSVTWTQQDDGSILVRTEGDEE